MSVHIIIDGYNVIRRSASLSDADRRDIELGREQLLEYLASYRKIRPHKITVVFDGAAAPAGSQPRDRIRGIHVRFSRRGESADTVIKRMASTEREKALVVSSDRDVAAAAARSGAATIDAGEFENKLALALYSENRPEDERSNGAWVPTTKKKGPRRRLPKRKRHSRSKIDKL
jgi:predicted RNA-binding protein with PIN domain